jgi:signal transduction histidine kinase
MDPNALGPKTDTAFLDAPGEMARRTREFDWTKTPLGAIDAWPQSLRTAVGIVLRSKFPMFIWWGPELVQFYNDGYRPSLGADGKHPLALGQKGEECWPEIWPVIYPLIRQVLDGGEATWSEDQLIPIYRNGKLEDVYWTFGYSAIIDEQDAVGGVLVVCHENTEKMIHYQKLVESEAELSFAIDAAELSTWDLNPLTNKFTSNARLKSWFGLRADERIGLSEAIEAIIKEDQPRVAAAIQRALQFESGGYYDIVYTIVNKATQQERIVRAKGRAWFNEEKIAYRFNGTLQDITEQETAQRKFAEQLGRQVKERTLELQRSNEDLLQFAHVISHDLKEPVRKVKMFTQGIQDELTDPISEKARNYFAKIRTAMNRMTAMIEGVLTYSSLNASQEAARPVDLDKLVSDIETDLEIPIREKKATIIRKTLPAIEGAPVLLHQLFYNLINNSLKFSRQDTPPIITISGQLAEEPGVEFARITVADNGIGFDQQYAASVFNSFTRLNAKDRYEGTGLGLALSKKIAERHGGSITAISSPGQGTAIIVQLPYHPTRS